MYRVSFSAQMCVGYSSQTEDIYLFSEHTNIMCLPDRYRNVHHVCVLKRGTGIQLPEGLPSSLHGDMALRGLSGSLNRVPLYREG